MSAEVLNSAEHWPIRAAAAFSAWVRHDDRIRMAFTCGPAWTRCRSISHADHGDAVRHSHAIAPLEALHAIALFRLILPEKEIRVCAGRGTGLRALHPLIFSAGADGFMIGNYLTTSGLDPDEDLLMLKDLGLTI
jgi:hypothetical protein